MPILPPDMLAFVALFIVPLTLIIGAIYFIDRRMRQVSKDDSLKDKYLDKSSRRLAKKPGDMIAPSDHAEINKLVSKTKLELKAEERLNQAES